MTSDDEAARAISVAERIVEVLGSETDRTLALAGMAMATAWLVTRHASSEPEAEQLLEAMGATTREQLGVTWEGMIN